MSDDERLDFRKLPPVDWDVAAPERFSQTLLRHANVCPRSAALYLRHHGGGASHPLDRGSAFHLFAERMALELKSSGSPSYWQPAQHEDVILAQREVASMTKVMVDEILDAPENGFVVPHWEAEHVRTMAYHLALGWPGVCEDMESLYGVERKFVLDLPSGRTVSGKVDLLLWPEPLEVEVVDYKSSLAVPDQGDFEDSFQPRLYGALVLFGCPVEKLEDGTEVRLDPIGEHIQRVKGRQIHPRARPKWDEHGHVELVERSATWSRKDLIDFIHDVDRARARIEHGVATRDWPARHGKHCAECPSEPECPLPRDLRRFAGAINTAAEASEAMEWALRMGERVTRTKKEVRAFAEHEGEQGRPTALPVGTETFDFETSWRRQLRRRGREADWEGLEAAASQPDFDIRDWVKESPANAYKRVRSTNGGTDNR